MQSAEICSIDCLSRRTDISSERYRRRSVRYSARIKCSIL
nr:MAG TPA: hypothetical protein [Caudoviricetes sp.]